MKKLFLLFLLFQNLSSFSQDNDSLSAETKRLLLLNSSRPIIGLEYEIGASNNEINFNSIQDFASKSFLDNAYKEDLLSQIDGPVRFAYWQTYTLSWDKPSYSILEKYVGGSKFSIRNEFISSAELSEEGVELGLFGNSRFAGETVDLSKSNFESWWFTSLEYEYDFLKRDVNYTFRGALVIGHSYEYYNIETAKVFTESSGEYIDAELNYDFFSTNNNLSIPFQGLGASGGIKTEKKVNKKLSIGADLNNLGFIYWSGGNEVKVDSSFRFRGVTFDNLFEINDSLREAEIDKIGNGLYLEEDAEKASLMPFQAQLFANYKIDFGLLKYLNFEIDYRYFKAYTPRYGLIALIGINKTNNAKLGLRFGGFNSLAIPIDYSIQLNKWKIAIGSSNILALPFPSQTVGSSIYAGLFYSL